MEKGKTTAESYTEQVHLVNHADLNGYKRLFGGTLVSWIDIVAGIVARRHSGRNVTTVAIDSLEFIKPAYANDLIVLCGKLTYVGKTSMEVCITSYVEHLNGTRNTINKAYFVMVALDENERPTAVPPLILSTDEEKREYEAAKKRKELRKLK